MRPLEPIVACLLGAYLAALLGPAPALAESPEAMSPPVELAAEPQWQHILNDPHVGDLVARALFANLDIEQAAARLDQASAAAAAARAALLPQIGASASGAALRQSLEDPAIRPFAGLPGFARDVERYEAGLAASWEIDLFGSAPRRRAARAGAAAVAADLAAVGVAVAAETATVWYNLLELQARLDVARGRLTSLERQQAALGLRARSGTIARLDVDRFEAETQAAAVAVPVLTALIAAETERLGVLIADADHARVLASQLPPSPDVPDSAAVSSLPVTLAARPDVVAAGHRLEAATAGVAASRAQRLPRVQLGALLASVAASPSALFSGPALAARASAGLAMPLFDFGRIDAAIAGARGSEREALAAYRQTMFLAAADVDSALALLAARRQEIALQESAVRAADRALLAAIRNHEAGVSDLTTLLDVERSHFSATEAYAVAKASHARALVALLRATATLPGLPYPDTGDIAGAEEAGQLSVSARSLSNDGTEGGLPNRTTACRNGASPACMLEGTGRQAPAAGGPSSFT
jgi:NodT family efflux transporter outer membrane factor (OMF) lipoprotein